MVGLLQSSLCVLSIRAACPGSSCVRRTATPSAVALVLFDSPNWASPVGSDGRGDQMWPQRTLKSSPCSPGSGRDARPSAFGQAWPPYLL